MVSIKFHDYQREAINFLLYRLFVEDKPGGGLFLDPGLGKTAITLEVIRHARETWGLTGRVLIAAPLRVIYSVWPAQVDEWQFPFKTSIVHGSATQRRNALAKSPAHLFLTNPENLPWLADQSRERFDLLVIDESTKFKTWTAKRTKALRKLLPRVRKRIILTGTPSPNSYCDLPSQLFCCDNGEALGKTLSAFRSAYCVSAGFMGRGWDVPPAKQAEINERIAPICLRMACEDHLDMPAKVDNVVSVDLPHNIRPIYDEVERKLFAELDSGDTLRASNGGAKYSLCRQIANGGAYLTDELTGERSEIAVHDAKVDAAADLVEELSGKPVLVAYQFQHDAARLARRFPKAPVIRGGMPPRESARVIDDWNAGRLPVLLVQPQALSHGANMQAGGRDLIWFGHTDQLEIYLQFNARLWRQGQTGQVRFHHLIARDTIDEAVYERILMKDERQAALLDALKRYRERI